MKQPKWIKIKFQKLQILHSNPVIDSYFSITFNDNLYFSSLFDDQSTLQIKNDIIIPLDGSLLDFVSLQRWESHVIVFDQQISIAELKTKSIIKKTHEVRKNQILTLTVTVSGQKDIIVCDKLIRKVSQHFLLLQNIKMKQQKSQSRSDIGACFFQILTSSSKFCIPVLNGNCLIYLPQTFQISSFKNNKLHSKSKLLTFQQLSGNIQSIQLFTQSNNSIGWVTFQSKWIVDVGVDNQLQYLLIHSVQTMIYQFQIKFDVPNDFIGSRLKVTSGNKLFQFNDQLGNTKIIKIKKAIWVVSKSQNDVIEIKIQRNNQVLSRIDLIIRDIPFCELIKYKQKLTDASNVLKTLGLIKFNIEKSQGNQNPSNDKFWKQCLKKKSTCSLMIEQVSIYYDQDEKLSLMIKTQTQQKKVNKLQNMNFFQEEPLIYHNPIVINPKIDEAIYFMLKRQHGRDYQQLSNNQDFLGIAVLNVGDIKLGKGPCQIDFYKNQQKLGSVNCLITKFIPIPFSKPIFHPQMVPIEKSLDLSISLPSLTLSPYFFSYKYDMQSQVFCIIQVNKQKKVLILQPTFQELSFISSSTSDLLLFSVDVQEIIKVKVTVMVGDGRREAIYGTASFVFKMDQIREQQIIRKKDLQFHNFTDTFVGKCNLTFQIIKQSTKKLEKSKSKQKLPFKSRNRSSNSKKQKQQKRKSISVMDNLNIEPKQIKLIKNLLPSRKNHIRQQSNQFQRKSYDSKQQSFLNVKSPQKSSPLKLPLISSKQQKKDSSSFSDLLISMNMRKRTIVGYDYNRPQQDKSSKVYQQLTKPHQQSFKPINSQSKQIDYQDLRNSSNIERNFQILFPTKKINKQQYIKNQLNKYQQKLKGLKSVLQQIDRDIDPIEPSIKGNNTQNNSRDQHHQQYQYAENQFM